MKNFLVPNNDCLILIPNVGRRVGSRQCLGVVGQTCVKLYVQRLVVDVGDGRIEDFTFSVNEEDGDARLNIISLSLQDQ